MASNGQSVQSMNKKKVKLLKKKRQETKNQKKVTVLAKGKRNVLRKHRPSKKKQQKDAKRIRIVVDSEKAKLLKSGLITQEDIDKLKNGDNDGEDDDEEAEEGMDLDN